MEVFDWQDRYRTGIESVDRQHMALFALCNSVACSDERASVLEILRQMREYAIAHFRDEEACMAALHYPDLGRHRAEHDSFSIRIGDFLHGVSRGESSVEQLHRYLLDWLRDHIVNADGAFGRYALTSGR